MSTGISARRERSRFQGIGDAVAVFAQGPIGLCATAGARACRVHQSIIAVDSVPKRKEFAKRMGADVVLDRKRRKTTWWRKWEGLDRR